MDCARGCGNRASSEQVLATRRRSADARCLQPEKRSQDLARIRSHGHSSSVGRAWNRPFFILSPFLPTHAGVESAQNQAELAPSAGPSYQEETMRRTLVVLGADRKSTRLNSSHLVISYAVFCLKKKKNKNENC